MRQMIANGVTTELLARPGVFVLQRSGRTSWAEVGDDDVLLLGPAGEGGEWSLFRQDSGQEVTVPAGAPSIVIPWPSELAQDLAEGLADAAAGRVVPAEDIAADLAARRAAGEPGNRR